MTLFGPFSPDQEQQQGPAEQEQQPGPPEQEQQQGPPEQEQQQGQQNPPLCASPQGGQTPSHVPEYQQMMTEQTIIQEAQICRSQPDYVIQPPTRNRKLNRQRGLPAIVLSLGLQRIIENTPSGDDVVRMLIQISTGEQRYISFSLSTPITITEVLQQVNVPVNRNTNITVTEVDAEGIDYIVCVL